MPFVNATWNYLFFLPQGISNISCSREYTFRRLPSAFLCVESPPPPIGAESQLSDSQCVLCAPCYCTPLAFNAIAPRHFSPTMPIISCWPPRARFQHRLRRRCRPPTLSPAAHKITALTGDGLICVITICHLWLGRLEMASHSLFLSVSFTQGDGAVVCQKDLLREERKKNKQDCGCQ